MDKTWRERIAEARQRGHFTADDKEAWSFPERCLVGEVTSGYVDRFQHLKWVSLYNAIGSQGAGSPLQRTALDAIYTDDFDLLERTLDAIEDRALEIKRAGGTDTP